MIEKPLLIVLAGPNGASKTTVTKKVIQHNWARECIYVNPDEIARNEFGDWNNREAILRAAQKANYIREKCIADRKSLIFETVFSAKEKIDFILKAKKNGYFIRFFFINTEHPFINIDRVAHRLMSGGHGVPTQKIISRYSKSIHNCAIIANMVDRLYVYDNSINYQDPVLLFRGKNGVLGKQYTSIKKSNKLIFDLL